jgi:hypothetical protein
MSNNDENGERWKIPRDLRHLILNKDAAKARGMENHAGEFNMATEEGMLRRFLGEFKHSPKRKYALVEIEVMVHGRDKGLPRVEIWADKPKKANYAPTPASAKKEIAALRGL